MDSTEAVSIGNQAATKVKDKIDCAALIDEYTPLLSAGLEVSEHVATEKPLYLRQNCETIIKVSDRLIAEHPEMVSTDIIKMLRGSAEDIIGVIDLARKQGKPIPYESLSREGTHLEMLALEAMILDTARCVCQER